MSVRDFLHHLTTDREYAGRIAHLQDLPQREAVYAEPDEPLPPPLKEALASLGAKQLYFHQAAALDRLRAGKDIIVVTGTASGKSLCYNLAVFESLLNDPSTRALYLFPTKALAQDQLRGIARLAEALPGNGNSNRSGGAAGKGIIKAATYDGDTPSHQRAKIRREAAIVLSNPDMLHAGILPYHAKWARFFADLRYIVLDEVHTCRGIFGSNVANVLRRLERICHHYGSSPQVICSSATIANPVELARALTGRDVELIDNDGSPKGRRTFVFWNPPYQDNLQVERRSANVEAQHLLADLIEQGIQTIAFTRARVIAELVYRYTRDYFQKRKSPLAERIRPYRGGYLPEDRRKIEQALFKGEILGVISTNALELGIDVGGLDACLMIGYPGTLASTWQQAGRAGRSSTDSLVILVGYNDPIDQYLMRHPDYLFGGSPEHAVLDSQNAYILFNHLRCAAYEIPLRPEDEAYFGPLYGEILELITESGLVKQIDDRSYWSSPDYPAQSVSLRTLSDNTCAIIDKTGGRAVTIGNIDSTSAPELVYDEAIYLHEGETWYVERLDMEGKVAYVRREEVDYYTRPSVASSLTVLEAQDRRKEDHYEVFVGEAEARWQTVSFTRYKFYTGENIGTIALDLPPQELRTIAAWLVPDASVLESLRDEGLRPLDGLIALRNLMHTVLPMMAMCERRDISGIVDSRNTGVPTLFLYDRYAGGLGFAEKAFEMMGELLAKCAALVEECPCQHGCPSCVGVAHEALAADPDSQAPQPGKFAARVLLGRL